MFEGIRSEDIRESLKALEVEAKLRWSAHENIKSQIKLIEGLLRSWCVPITSFDGSQLQCQHVSYVEPSKDYAFFRGRWHGYAFDGKNICASFAWAEKRSMTDEQENLLDAHLKPILQMPMMDLDKLLDCPWEKHIDKMLQDIALYLQESAPMFFEGKESDAENASS